VSADFRILANMTLWGKEVEFSFSAMANEGYAGIITFPEKFSLGDLMRKIWAETAGEEPFPLGDLSLEIESVKAAMNKTKDGKASLVMFEVLIGGIQLGVYFVKDHIKETEATLFLINTKNEIKIESLPGVEINLPEPIRANVSLCLSTGPAEFSLGGKKYTYEKGIGFDSYINIPEVLNKRFSYTYRPNNKKKEDATTNKLPTSNPENLSQEQPTEQQRPAKPTPAVIPTPKTKSPFKWNKVDYKIGKVVKIHRIGNGYFDPKDMINGKEKRLVLMFDLSVYISKLSISLIGLVVTIDIKKIFSSEILHSFGIGLKGLAFSLETKTLTLGGLFSKNLIYHNNKYYEQYVGGVMLKFSKLSITGIGAYGKIEGFKSFFIYAIAGIPEMGIPEFMVQKIALGYGRNRRILIPDVKRIADFPLVSMAMSDEIPDKKPTDQLQDIVPMIVEYFPPKESASFFAIGVKFNTYRILNGFILLIVSWGEKLRFDILGFLVLNRPLSHPVVSIRISIKATFIPEDGTIQVDGEISKGSYIISEKARLTGNFVLYSWLKDIPSKGIQAGDFVMSIGGYHPLYNIPAHYPPVPRFKLSWGDPSKKLSITAEAYMALTPSAIMFGAKFSAIYTTDNFKAWFDIRAHFILQWKPFAYSGNSWVRIGGEVRMRMWGLRIARWTLLGPVLESYHWYISKSFSISVKVQIWGPDFGGIASISVLGFNKKIHFGARKKLGQNRIGWPAFRDDLLPSKDKIISLNITAGKLKEKNKQAIVDPGSFVIEIGSKIPITELSVSGNSKQTFSSFGVYPVLDGRKAVSTFILKTYYTPLNQKKAIETDQFEITLIKGSLPAALWSSKDQLKLNDPEKLIPAITGVKLCPKKQKRPPSIELKKLPKFSVFPHPTGWKWKPNKYTLIEEVEDNKIGYQFKSNYGAFNEDFQEVGNDLSKLALRKKPENIAKF